MEMQIVVLSLWTLGSLCATQEVPYGQECEYHGDMEDVSVENCIAKMQADHNIDRCSGVIYGPGRLYRKREELPFWIDIKPIDRHLYPDDLTYKILHMSDSNNVSSLNRIPGCEGIYLNGMDNCSLPPKIENKDESNWIYMPLLNDPYYSYCRYEIEEWDEDIIEYCDGVDYERSCYEMSSGRYIRRNPFYPVDAGLNFPIRTEFCFFSTPEIYVDVTGDWNKIRLQPNITSEGAGQNISASFGDEKVECTIIRTHNSEEQHPAKLARKFQNDNSDFVCFFLRAPTENTAWTTAASCLRVEHEENNPDVILTIALILTFVLLIFAAVWLYKGHYVPYTVKKIRKEFQQSLAVKPNNFLECDKEHNLAVQENEIPFEITICSEMSNYLNEGSLIHESIRRTKEEHIEILPTDSETSSDYYVVAPVTTDYVVHG